MNKKKSEQTKEWTKENEYKREKGQRKKERKGNYSFVHWEKNREKAKEFLGSQRY